jgi:DNA-binding SARP family transcriptional activator
MIFLHTLGTAYIDGGDVRVTPAYSRKFALLLRLSADGDLPVPRSELEEQIFPDSSPRNAAHSLRDLVYRLRLEGFPIEVRLETAALTVGSAQTDYGEIMNRERLTPRDIGAVASGFLPGYAPARMVSFSEWLGAYRARTTIALCRALSKQIAIFRSIGDWSMTEQTARACLSLDASNEEATLALAEMLALGGAKMKAVALLDKYMRSVSKVSSDLRLPAAVLRRRIGERLPTQVRSSKAMPFVGRDREMLLLRERFLAMKEERSQCVVISGEPGIGKSRLATEFSNLAALEGAHVERAAAQPHDVHRPMAALADLVPGLMQQRGALGCTPESMQALRRLTSRGDQPVEYRLDDAQASEALYFSITRAVTDLIDAVSAERPLMLLVEDMHWLDDVSIRILGQIAATRNRRRVLILFTSRDASGTKAFPAHADSVLEIALERLDDPAVDRLIAAEHDIATVAGDESMRRWLRTTSGGNPLFFQSLVAHYVETGQRFSVPPTLLSLLQQRVARLTEPAALTLQMCVLFGKYATLERIEEAVHLPRVQLLSAFSELERARLIEANGDEVRPAHALIADAAVQRFSALENRVAHRYVAEVLEQVAASSRTPSVVWDCAEHWVTAENRERAVATLRRCAELSLEVGRPRGAAEALLRAVDLSEPSQLQQRLAREAVMAAHFASEPALVFRGLRELRERGRSSMHDDFEFAEFTAAVRLHRESKPYVAQLLHCIEAESASPNHRVAAATLFLKHADTMGDAAAAAAALSKLSADSLAAADDTPRLEFQMILAAINADHTEVLRLAPLLVERIGSAPPIRNAACLSNAAFAMWQSGATQEALDLARSAHARATEVEAHRIRLNTAVMITNMYGDLWIDDEAELWLEKTESIGAEFPDFEEEFGPLITGIEYRIAVGKREKARQIFESRQSRSLFEGSVPKERWAHAFRIAFDLADKGVSREGIESLLYPANRVGMGGLRDFEVGIACSALIARGQLCEAELALVSYVKSERRLRSPLGRTLETASRMLQSMGPISGPVESDDLRTLRHQSLASRVREIPEADGTLARRSAGAAIPQPSYSVKQTRGSNTDSPTSDR